MPVGREVIQPVRAPPLLTAACGLGPQLLIQTLGSDVSRDGDVFGDREDAACAVCHVSVPPPLGSVSAVRHKDKGHRCPPTPSGQAVPPCEPATRSGNEWARWVLSQGRQIPGEHPVGPCPPWARCHGAVPAEPGTGSAPALQGRKRAPTTAVPGLGHRAGAGSGQGHAAALKKPPLGSSGRFEKQRCSFGPQ